MELSSEEQNKGKRIKTTKDNLSGLYDNIKYANIQIIQFPEELKGKKMYEDIFEQRIVGNFPNTEKEIANFNQEAQRAPHRVDPSRNMERQILIKLPKLNI